MKYFDIFVQALAYARGITENEVGNLVDTISNLNPKMVENLSREISDDEAQRLLTELRAEESGVLAWLMKGSQEGDSQ